MSERAAYWLGLIRDWVLALIVVVAGFATYQFIASPPVRSAGPAPDFSLSDPLTGQQVTLSDHGDKVVVLNFWFTDCGPCRHEIPELSAWAKRNPDVPLIGVSTDRYEAPVVKARAQQLGVRYTVAHDQDARVAQLYNVSMFPTTLVVKEGQIRQARLGLVDQVMLDEMVREARR